MMPQTPVLFTFNQAKEQKLVNMRKEAEERKEDAIRRKQELEEKRVSHF